MANDCNNTFLVRHDDPAMVDRFEAAFKEARLFNEFFPMTQELSTADSPCRDEALKASNIEKYGAEDWYEWAYANWGVKRDVGGDNSGGCGDGNITRNGNEISGWFYSAWNPPTEAFIRFGDLGFKYDLSYDEPGFAFIGILSWDGETLRNECYSFDFGKLKEEGLNWEEVIPEEFHEHVEQY
ncbi:MAG: hypothetical protein WCK65_15895 [Rhodospirillaceae bacterium]